MDVLLHSPVKRVEGEDTEFGVVVAVGTTCKEELRKLGDVLAEKGNLEDEESLEDIKELTRARFVAALDALANNLDHTREEVLERFLRRLSMIFSN